MKAFKPQECDFFILNMLNEYNPESLMASIFKDAVERQDVFGDEMEVCIGLAQTFSNAMLTQTGRCLAKEGLVVEQPNTVEEIHNAVDFKLTPKGRDTWATVSRQCPNEVQRPGWTKMC